MTTDEGQRRSAFSPGWHPDPWGPQGQMRFHDGVDWSQHVMAAPEPAPQRRGQGSFARLSVAGFLLAVVVIAFAVFKGQEIRKVSPTGDVEFYSTGGGGSGEEITVRQDDIDRRVAELEGEAQQQGGGLPAPAGIDLTGQWAGDNGLTYVIQQYGPQAVIQEMSYYGVTATGNGTFDGTTAWFSFVAFDGSTGEAVLTLQDQRTLSGTFTNYVAGVTVPATLRR